MATNKEKVFDFLVDYTKEYQAVDEDLVKFDTIFLSQKLHIQRSNVSTILNQLVQEGKITKYNGRPVLYSLSKDVRTSDTFDPFASLVGFDGSLEKEIQYIKAAITYPDRLTKILITGQKGTGIRSLSEKTYEYACNKGILKKNSPYIIFECQHFDVLRIEKEILEKNIWEQASNGLLLLKNADHVPLNVIANLFEKVNQDGHRKYIILIHISDMKNIEYFKDFFNLIVSLPSLKERPIKERFLLVESYFRNEASRLNRRIEVNYGLMQCLMLYICEENLTELEKNIQFGIANAYLKSKRNRNIKLELSNLPNHVRKGLLYIEENQMELDKVLIKNNTYIFEAEQTYHVQPHEGSLDIYHRLDQKQKLLGKSINQQDLETFVFANIELELKDYLEQLTNDYNDQKLEQHVSEKLRSLVRGFVNHASQTFNKVYSKKIYYGICLHLYNALIITKPKRRISNEKIMEIMELYDEEYIFSRKFIRRVQSEFNVKFSIDETIFITLFLTLDFEHPMKHSEVVTLIAMHGNGAAAAIAEVIQQLIPANNLETFDLSLNEDIEVSYERLKNKIVNCNRGKGVFVIYDMGSIQIMLNSIIDDTNIEIRYMEMPISLLAIASCQYGQEGKSVSQIYERVLEEFSGSPFIKKINKDIVIALSTAEENNSDTIQNYLTTLEDYKNYNIISYNISDRRYLINQLNQIKNVGKIVGIVGTYNPEIFNLKYVNYQDASNVRTIHELFVKTKDDFNVFDYLTEQFKIFTQVDLQVTLLPFLNKLEGSFNQQLSEDMRMGFLIHMGCLIDRLVKKQGSAANFKEQEIQKSYPKEIENVRTLISPIEDYYAVSFSLGDIATVVDIFMNQEGGS